MINGLFITFEHRDREYGYVYLEKATPLSVDDEVGLLAQLVDMDIDRKKRSNVRGESFEGHAVDRGFHMIGGIGGTWYDVTLEIGDKNLRAGYLLNDRSSHLNN